MLTNNYWFGKGCPWFCCTWERDSTEEDTPELVFCNHPDNVEETEGNCRATNCPLGLQWTHPD